MAEIYSSNPTIENKASNLDEEGVFLKKGKNLPEPPVCDLCEWKTYLLEIGMRRCPRLGNREEIDLFVIEVHSKCLPKIEIQRKCIEVNEYDCWVRNGPKP